MVLCCGVCWKFTAILGILINLTEEEPCSLASLGLCSKTVLLVVRNAVGGSTLSHLLPVRGKWVGYQKHH
jgi:hypothetical protein